MKDLFFGFDNATRTLLVFSIVLWTFVIIPIFYLTLQPASLNKLQKRPVFMDWRFWIPMLTYALLLGFRYDYSFDWDQYKSTFNYLQRGLIYRDDTELGYMFINKLLILCGFNFYSIFILEAIVYVTSIYYLLKDNRQYLLFVLPIVYMAQYSNCLNISRQFFAMSVLYIAYRNLLDGKRILYFLLGIVACTIHSSAYIWIVVFFLFWKLDEVKINLKYFFIACIVSSVVVYSFKDALYGMLSNVTGMFTAKSYYGDGGILADCFLRDDMPLTMFLVRFVRALMYIYMYNIQNRLGLFKNNTILKNYILVGLVTSPIVILMGTHEIFSRMLYYVSVFSDLGWGILSYNYFLHVFKKKFVVWEFMIMAICTLQFVWSYYSQIVANFFNIATNLFIIYK